MAGCGATAASVRAAAACLCSGGQTLPVRGTTRRQAGTCAGFSVLSLQPASCCAQPCTQQTPRLKPTLEPKIPNRGRAYDYHGPGYACC